VKDASEFQAIQADLQQLKAGIGSDNPEVDSLISRANRIAKMNDRCSMVSINDVLD
jgi:capsule polysaccharide export protein KpsE/RkpR